MVGRPHFAERSAAWRHFAGRSAAWRRTAVAVLFGLLLAAGGAWATFDGARYVRDATWAGTPGTLTVAGCRLTYPDDRRDRELTCVGEFVSRDGTVSDPRASLTTRSRLSGKVAVARTPGGSYVRTSLAAVLGHVDIVLIGLTILGTVAAAAWSVARRSAPRPAWRAIAVLGASALAVALATAVISIAGSG
ncbi:hypothetical protein [Actinacidiphila yeochonensis]|uniref:hypothetical protein n=1 Tax=Actinacidiphila yeochonensis TaxID=89050 RepID=UPI000565FD7C|nr:hypothetical protein [Actinacidiphila yeochonensis]